MGLILGVHTNLTGGSSDKNAPLTGGHAWISVHNGSSVTYYGLWPDNHPRTIDNGAQSDIRIGMEKHDRAADSRYYQLSAEQEIVLNKLIRENVKWKATHNCSSWATEIIHKVTRENVSANEPVFAFVETPRRLGLSIRKLEDKNPTSLLKPAAPKPPRQARSSSFSHRRATN